MDAGCPLCHARDETVLWRGPECRVIHVADAAYVGYCRVIWQAHVREMTDLDPAARAKCMNIVWKVEEALRALLRPDKINLASLGNVVPHVHWHVIPRFRDDPHFPDPIWAPARRAGAVRTLDLALLTAALEARIIGGGDKNNKRG